MKNGINFFSTSWRHQPVEHVCVCTQEHYRSLLCWILHGIDPRNYWHSMPQNNPKLQI